MSNSPSFLPWTRRSLLGGLALPGLGGVLAARSAPAATSPARPIARNVLVFVSDGMNMGTLTMAGLYAERILNRVDPWLGLYDGRRNVRRALMETASASGPVTDSAAASSAWSSGRRVPNGRINMTAENERLTPIYQTLAGKKWTGLVTTARVTHATPAGFAAVVPHRDQEDLIAGQYAGVGVRVILGGGARHYDPAVRPDKEDVFGKYASQGYAIARTKAELESAPGDVPLLGCFAPAYLPMAIDRLREPGVAAVVPSLAAMTRVALDRLSRSPEGFVLQVEGARIDHAGHANDLGGIVREQTDFGEALALGIAYADAHPDTLLIVTTDHGCGGPDLNGSGAEYRDSGKRFDRITRITTSHEDLARRLAELPALDDASVDAACAELALELPKSVRQAVLDRLGDFHAKKKLGPEAFGGVIAPLQSAESAVSWNGQVHTAEHVELAAFGPGSERLAPWIRNDGLRGFLLGSMGI